MLLVLVVYFRVKTKRGCDLDKATLLTPSRFTVELTGLPKYLNDSKELESFLKQFCVRENIADPDETVIVEASLVRKYKGNLLLHKQAAELIAKIKSEKKRLEIRNQQLSSKLERMEKKLKTIQINLHLKVGSYQKKDFLDTLKAFVIFNSIDQKRKFIEAIDSINYPSFLSRIFTHKNVNPSKKFLETYQLYANSRVDEPSNIKWENMHRTTGTYQQNTLLTEQ